MSTRQWQRPGPGEISNKDTDPPVWEAEKTRNLGKTHRTKKGSLEGRMEGAEEALST